MKIGKVKKKYSKITCKLLAGYFFCVPLHRSHRCWRKIQQIHHFIYNIIREGVV